ncbi:MAG: hypothetical protein RBR43_03035 [Desulfuromonadaceae bacterium]|nr:hypothetical protein [Desulfuromonas sp.]MDY0184839.1 hypothetical protein [Desulfuromonadaceae bacterium]
MNTQRLQILGLAIGITAAFMFCPQVSMSQTEVSLNDAQQDPSFEQGQKPVAPPGRQGNILNIVLGRSPERSTERGTLVMEAFHDVNGDGIHNEGEELLRDEISCIVDEVNYVLPAFIPGLDYNARYSIKCRGKQKYEPTAVTKNVLVARRGTIISISIPCDLVE